MKSIIAIQGKRASGKDTTALFLQYLLGTPKWMHWYWLAKLLKFKPLRNTYKIVKYADSLKLALSAIIGVPKERFEDRDFKENYYFNFSDYKLIDGRIQTPNSIKDHTFNRLLNKGDLTVALNYDLSIRQILMFFGTNIMRQFFGDKLWIHTTLNNNTSNIIISDQRFIIENKMALNLNAHIIHIIRNLEGTSGHPSESELDTLLTDHQYHTLLDNNGSLKDLFNTIKQLEL